MRASKHPCKKIEVLDGTLDAASKTASTKSSTSITGDILLRCVKNANGEAIIPEPQGKKKPMGIKTAPSQYDGVHSEKESGKSKTTEFRTQKYSSGAKIHDADGKAAKVVPEARASLLSSKSMF